MTQTAVTVVVATHNRRDRLAGLVAALGQQTGVDFDVVIVDDASTDGTPAELDRLAAACPVPVRICRLDANHGPATARNVGWRSSAAPLVAFTDDDCLPRPGWLAALVGRFETDPAVGIVQGRTVPDPSVDLLDRPFHHTVRVERPDGSYPTCNIAYRRELLVRLGGFDERFGPIAGDAHRAPLYGEDVDLAWRALESGATAVFEPDAVVHHEVTASDFRRRLRHSRRMAGTVQVVADHPAYRDTFPYGWFYKASHPWALAALTGMVVAGTRPRSVSRLVVGAALTLPYLHHRTRVDAPSCRRRDWPVYLPLTLAADLADIAVLAAASAKHRRLVL